MATVTIEKDDDGYIRIGDIIIPPDDWEYYLIHYCKDKKKKIEFLKREISKLKRRLKEIESNIN